MKLEQILKKPKECAYELIYIVKVDIHTVFYATLNVLYLIQIMIPCNHSGYISDVIIL